MIFVLLLVGVGINKKRCQFLQNCALFLAFDLVVYPPHGKRKYSSHIKFLIEYKKNAYKCQMRAYAADQLLFSIDCETGQLVLLPLSFPMCILCRARDKQTVRTIFANAMRKTSEIGLYN